VELGLLSYSAFVLSAKEQVVWLIWSLFVVVCCLGLKPNQLLPCPQTTTTTPQLPDAPTTYAIFVASFVPFLFYCLVIFLLFPRQFSLNTSVSQLRS
jgi:hypothetical protein